MVIEIGGDCQKIVTSFAWDVPITFVDLIQQVLICEDIQDSVPPSLLNPVVYDNNLNQYVPSPFRMGFPFYPVTNLACTTYWNRFLRYLPLYVTGEYLSAQKTYRNVFRRLVDKVYRSGFLHFNRLLSRYLVHLCESDLPIGDPETAQFIRELERSDSLARTSCLV
jgi:hypothetical protein